MTEFKSILLINAGALGDLVLSVGMIRRLGTVYAGARLSALCRNRVACYFARRGILAGWKSLESSSFAALFSSDRQLSGASREYLTSFDLVISMLGDPGEVVSHRLRECAGGELFSIDPNLRPDTEQQGMHIVEQWISDLRRQGMGIQRDGSSDHPNQDCIDSGNSRTAQAPDDIGIPARREGSLELERGTAHSAGGCILIHPGSGGRAKCWPVENFEQLARRLRSAGRRVQFMIGPVEMDLFGDHLRSRLSQTAPVIYEEDVCEAAEHVERASAFIGNDAGMTHLAAFLGIPTVAIFTATSSNVWRPVGGDVSVVDARDQNSNSAELIARMVCESRS